MKGDSRHPLWYAIADFMKLKDAISKIEQRGILLVYPLQNRSEPRSLWSEFYPRTKMRWEWDSEGADNRVAELWHLREEISRSGKVVYAKWFQGRATLFSKEIFSSLLAALPTDRIELSRGARQILQALEENSPLSTKELKKSCPLAGAGQARLYERALKELWGALLIVGYGEVDDGAFPSLAIGATSVLFEDLVTRASRLSEEKAHAYLTKNLGEESPFYRFYLKRRKLLRSPTSQSPRVAKTIRYEDLIKGS